MIIANIHEDISGGVGILSSLFDKKNCIELGRCASAHGLKGMASVELFNWEESILLKLPLVWLIPFRQGMGLFNEAKRLKIQSIDVTPKKAIIGLEGVNSRTELEHLIPFSIWIERDALPKAANNEVYLNDLIGIDTFDHVSGQCLGKVVQTYQVASQTVLVIRNMANSNKEFEIPFIDNFIHKIDLPGRRLEIVTPEYIDVDQGN